ncbi:ArnT family glycosyltransferase [Longispora albida]|uniref:ArnT family glycosyltransferase n=1 Tax=Longispora albida TaxID=203523 RepID=UPI00037D21F9|nr:glycosyltransferase family 39 protein [Longispora albida]
MAVTEARPVPVTVPAAPLTAIRTWVARHARSLVIAVPLTLLSLAVQAIGMGRYPQYTDDEGTYVAQAWAVSDLGELTHYTYWYDHPPAGWVQISGWAALTGGFGRYADAVLAGREAMLAAHLVSCLLLFALCRRFGLSRGASAVALTLFAFSPLAVVYHRMVYLDNVAVPWLLAAFLLAASPRGRLSAFAGAGVCFGVAVLTRETLLLALPALVWQVRRAAEPQIRRYALAVGGTLLVMTGAVYVLFAVVKGELLPGRDRVSLLGGIAYQLAGRDSSGSLLDEHSLARRIVALWLELDPVPVLLTLTLAPAAWAVRRLRPLVLALVLLVVAGARPGGYLPVPYIIGLLPFAALLSAGAGAAFWGWLWAARSRYRLAVIAVASGALVATALTVPRWVSTVSGPAMADANAPIAEARAWVLANVPRDSRLMVDDVFWLDLTRAGFDRDNVVWFTKVGADPDVPGEWAQYDYVLATNSVREYQLPDSGVRRAVAHGHPVAVFGTGRDRVEVLRIDSS